VVNYEPVSVSWARSGSRPPSGCGPQARGRMRTYFCASPKETASQGCSCKILNPVPGDPQSPYRFGPVSTESFMLKIPNLMDFRSRDAKFILPRSGGRTCGLPIRDTTSISCSNPLAQLGAGFRSIRKNLPHILFLYPCANAFQAAPLPLMSDFSLVVLKTGTVIACK
jgi:hypothetical protein